MYPVPITIVCNPLKLASWWLTFIIFFHGVCNRRALTPGSGRLSMSSTLLWNPHSALLSISLRTTVCCYWPICLISIKFLSVVRLHVYNFVDAEIYFCMNTSRCVLMIFLDATAYQKSQNFTIGRKRLGGIFHLLTGNKLWVFCCMFTGNLLGFSPYVYW